MREGSISGRTAADRLAIKFAARAASIPEMRQFASRAEANLWDTLYTLFRGEVGADVCRGGIMRVCVRAHTYGQLELSARR